MLTRSCIHSKLAADAWSETDGTERGMVAPWLICGLTSAGTALSLTSRPSTLAWAMIPGFGVLHSLVPQRGSRPIPMRRNTSGVDTHLRRGPYSRDSIDTLHGMSARQAGVGSTKRNEGSYSTLSTTDGIMCRVGGSWAWSYSRDCNITVFLPRY